MFQPHIVRWYTPYFPDRIPTSPACQSKAHRVDGVVASFTAYDDVDLINYSYWCLTCLRRCLSVVFCTRTIFFFLFPPKHFICVFSDVIRYRCVGVRYNASLPAGVCYGSTGAVSVAQPRSAYGTAPPDSAGTSLHATTAITTRLSRLDHNLQINSFIHRYIVSCVYV